VGRWIRWVHKVRRRVRSETRDGRRAVSAARSASSGWLSLVFFVLMHTWREVLIILAIVGLFFLI
jgi:hypothetical protein